MKPIMPETFGRVVDAIVDLSGLAKIDQSLEARVDAEKVDRASLEWVPLPALFGLAQAAGWTKERLSAEIDRQLGLAPPGEQGWRSRRVERQELIEVLVSKVLS